MASTFTVDASVFLNAFNPYEAGHEESHRLLGHLQAQAWPVIVPTLLLPEVAAARLPTWRRSIACGAATRSTWPSPCALAAP
jgi:hypothetical protein